MVSKINLRQIDILKDARAMADIQSVVNDEALFIMQISGAVGSNEMQVIKAKDMQTYFSHIDVDQASDNNEYTLVFIDPDAQDADHDGFVFHRDSQGYGALSYNPSSNLFALSGSMNLKDDAVSLRFGADQDVVLSHVADTGLVLNGARELQFRSSTSKVYSSDSSKLDLYAADAIKSEAPTVELEASTEVLLDSPKVHLEDDSARLVFGADEDARIAHDGSDGLDVVSAGGFDLDAGGAISLSGSSTGEIQLAGALDIDSAGAMSLDAAGGMNIGLAADVAVDFHASTLDIDASSTITIDSTANVLIQGSTGAGIGDDTESLAYDGSGNVDFDAVALDIDASGAISLSGSLTGEIQLAQGLDIDASTITVDAAQGLSLGGGAASDLTTTSGMLTLDGASGVRIAGNSSEIDITTTGLIDVNSGQFDLDASDVFSVSGSSTGEIQFGSSLDVDASSIDMDAAGIIAIGGVNATTVDLGRSGQETDILGTLSVDEDAVFDQNVTITGDLTVNGATTTLDTVNLLVEDPFVVMAKNVSGSPSMDQGLMFERGSSDNTAFIWDESADEFALIQTTSSHEVQGNVEILDYYNLHIGGLTVDDNATVGGTLDVTGAGEFDSTLGADGNFRVGSAGSSFFSVAATDGDTAIAGTLAVTGAASFNADVTVGDASGDTLTINAQTVNLVNVADSYTNDEVDQGSDDISDNRDYMMVFDHSAGTVKGMILEELGQFLASGTRTSTSGSQGVRVVANSDNNDEGQLGIEYIQHTFVSSAANSGTTFTMDYEYGDEILANSLAVYLNGQLLVDAATLDDSSVVSDYSVSNGSATLTMDEDIHANDVVVVRYIRK